MPNLKQAARAMIASTLLWYIFIPEITISQTRGPTYASPKAEKIIEKVLAAHGGLSKWRAAKTMRFTGIELYSVELTEGMSEWDRWGWSEQTFELATRRGYHDLPIEKASLGSDGKRIWSRGLQGGNPPGARYESIFYFINLPWLTQDPGVHIADPGVGKLPNDAQEYITIKLTFAPGVGNTKDDYHLLYIDKETFRLKATQYVVTYAALLDLLGFPPEKTSFGPLVRIFDDYVTVAGLTVPSRYRTYGADGEQLFGIHLISNIQFGIPLDESRMKLDLADVIDTSNPSQRMVSK